jgi:PGF-CTERM protein
MEMRNLQLVGISVMALVLAIAVIGILPATAADVSVTRDLPDDPVYPEDEISISLNQSGFYLTGVVTETLPEGFVYRGLASGSGGELLDYDENTNVLKIGFGTEATVTYRVKAGTAAQIENAVFSGTWSTTDSQMEKITGDVTGDTSLTLGVGPKPTPTPTPTPTEAPPSSGGGSGGVITPTPTATSGVMPSASPGATPTGSPGITVPLGSPTGTPTTATSSPTSSPTSQPLIPGFEAVFAVAGLLAVAYLVTRSGRWG